MTATGTDVHPGAAAGPAAARPPASRPAEAEPDVDDGAPWEILLVAAVSVVLGVGLRFVSRSPLWLDEALTVNIASLPLGDITEALRHDGHPPLYYWMLHGWIEVFGTSDTAVRGLSGLFGVLTLPLAWVVGRRRGGPLLAWCFLALMAISPFAVRYANETRMYSLVILLSLAGYLLVDDVVRRRRGGMLRHLALAVVAGLLVLSHYWAMWLLAATALVLVWIAWRDRRRPAEERRARACLTTVAAMGVGAVLALSWWVPTMLYQSAHTGTPWASPFRPTTTLSITLIDFNAGSGAFPDSPFLVVPGAIAFCIGLFGVALDRRHLRVDLATVRQFRYEAVLIAVTLGIGILTGYLARSTYASRYGAVFFAFYVLLVAGGVTRFVSRPVRVACLAFLCALSLAGAVHGSVIFQRSAARVVGEQVATYAAPDDLVVYCPDQLGPAGSREMPAGVRQVTYPRLEPPERVDWVDYATRNAAADPEEVARRVVELAGPERSIFVVYAGTYKTLEGQCERLLAAIADQRPEADDLVLAGAEPFYEPASLRRFRPASSGG